MDENVTKSGGGENLMENIIDILGNKMCGDRLNTLGLRSGRLYEPLETKVAIHFIKEGDSVLDIGAMIGYYTLVFAKSVGEKGNVFAFEPEAENRKVLRENVAMNEYRNVNVVGKAVGNVNGRVKLYLAEKNMGMHTTEYAVGKRFVEVEVVRVDDYLKEYKKKINFVKMDIQGAEFVALQGMERILNENREIKILMEFAPICLRGARVKPEEVLQLLIGWGFKLFRIDKHQKDVEKRRMERVRDIGELTRKCAMCEFLNLFCVRGDIERDEFMQKMLEREEAK